MVGGSAITADELDRALGNRLMRLRTEEYQIRLSILQDLIADRLLADEAARRHLPLQDLLAAEVESRIVMPSAEDLEAFYNGTRERFGGLSKEEALEQIVVGIHRQKVDQRKSEYVETLRSKAGTRVLLNPPRISVQAAGPSRGPATAPVTLVEFSDFECPFCSRAEGTIHKLQDRYGEKLRMIVVDYPLASHRGAPRAAEAVHCAEDQGKFWEMRDRLFAKGGASLSEADLRKAAEDSGADLAAFTTCLASGKHTPEWKASQAEGARVGVGSTPTFFVNGRMIIGAAPLETFVAAIEDELQRAQTTASH
jgi:protein-disulfide isomerase